MFPYRFEPDEPTPAPAPAPQPTAPRPAVAKIYTTPRPRRRRLGTAVLLGLALTGTTIGGGVMGGVAATRWLAPQAPAAILSPQPISTQNAPTGNVQGQTGTSTNVAGTVFNAVSGAVVTVTTASGGRGGLTPTGSGTGIVVAADGLILTNNHVVEGARTVAIRFADGTERSATVLGTDTGNDLAVLRVDLPANTPVATLGDSDQVQVGETAIAIGSPFGLEQTVTQGIVSAVDRTYFGGSGRVQRDLIQTDAPINPGNSGGPLLNARGEVIGINTLIESPIRGSVGVGFAVPINTAKRLLPSLEAGAQLEPVWLGITRQATAANSTQAGVPIASVSPNSPAAQAGLQVGDIITAVNGTAVNSIEDLVEQLGDRQPGDKITLTITRNGQQQQVEATLQARPIAE